MTTEFHSDPNHRFAVTTDTLVETAGDVAFEYGRWGRRCGVRRLDRSGPNRAGPHCAGPRRIVPVWQLFDGYGGIAVGSDEAPPRVDPNQLGFPWAPKPAQPGLVEEDPDATSTRSAFEWFAAEIPANVRDAAAAAGNLQWLALEALQVAPRVIDYLHPSAPRIDRTYGLVCLALGRNRPWHWRCRGYAKLAYRKRADVIDGLAASPIGKALVSRLGKLELCLEFRPGIVDRLSALFANPIKVRCLDAPETITGPLVDLLFRLPAHMIGPDFAAILGRLDGSDLVLLDRLTDMIFALPDDLRPEFEDRFRQARSVRRLLKLYEDCTDIVPVEPGPPPMAGDDRLVPIQSQADLRAEGVLLGHCIASYRTEIAMGQAYAYSWHGGERATVLLEAIEDGAWWLSDVRGDDNCLIGRDDRIAIGQLLTDQGCRVNWARLLNDTDDA